MLSLPTRPDLPHQAALRAAGELVKAGVKLAFAVPSETNARQLPYHAAQSVAWGLSRDEAIRALTINAAEILGVADRIGSIEPGKIANLIVAKGDPLEVRTRDHPRRHRRAATCRSTTGSSRSTSAIQRGRDGA